MKDWTYSNPIKSKLAEKLSNIHVSRNLMIQCLEVYYFLELEQLEKIYENLSINQKKALQGRALSVIIDYKKNYL